MDDKELAEAQAKMQEYLKSPEYQKNVEEQLKRVEAEYAIKETADWFGKTGLEEEVERELPHYLRREMGESLLEEGSLKANDLKYVGAFKKVDGSVEHFWRIPWGDKEVYAKITEDVDSVYTEWGSDKPPELPLNDDPGRGRS